MEGLSLESRGGGEEVSSRSHSSSFSFSRSAARSAFSAFFASEREKIVLKVGAAGLSLGTGSREEDEAGRVPIGKGWATAW